MIAAALFAALIAAAPADGCADHWAVELDRPSFAGNGAGRIFTRAELAAFRNRVATALKVAGADACRGGKVRAARAAAIRRVRVMSASGATEPQVYASGKGALTLEWVFAEESLAVPPRATLVGALMCWADPRERLCADEGD